MKRNLLITAALGASLLSSGYLLGQNKAGAPAAAAQKQTRLVRVVTLENAQANREFQNNVQLVQAQRQAAAALDSQIKAEKDAKKKKELEGQLEQILKKLNENNAQMVKTYGFSLTRNYVLEIEKASVYMEVTEEEAAKIDQEQKAQAKKK
jgi:hypothetical protein